MFSLLSVARCRSEPAAVVLRGHGEEALHHQRQRAGHQQHRGGPRRLRRVASVR